jgi:signal transduction histidine kinase
MTSIHSLIRKRSDILIPLVAIIILGGFLSFIFLTITDSIRDALLVGNFYGIIFVLTLTLVQRMVISKLTVFGSVQQWILRSFVYAISICMAYLAGFLFQYAILKPELNLTEFIEDTFWSNFVAFISSPLDLEFISSFFKGENLIALVPFFAVIILISMVSLIGSFVEMRWQQNRQQLAVDRAELTALKAQIEPHFLFNSLNTIASEIRNDPDKAEQLIIQLSDILRYLFDNSSREMIRIDEEIGFLKKYADLIKARFDDKIEIKWRNSLQNGGIEVPLLILQPLVENSIRHGRGENTDILKITIDISDDDNTIVCKVIDNGQGIESTRIKKLPAAGHALANIHDRLYLNYKRTDLLKIESELGQGTTVSIEMPKRKK